MLGRRWPRSVRDSQVVDLARLRALLDRLGSRHDELREFAELDVESYIADRRALLASKYLLVTAIESSLSIANHVIASEGYRAPTDYADAFRSLSEAGVIEGALAERLEAMARFRNLLVHLYAEVDDRRVHTFLENDPGDLRAFMRAILERFGRS